MEFPVINFEASINSLNNPSLFSRILSIFELAKLSQAQRFWKWGALFLALVYAFNCVVQKIKILILHYHSKSKAFLAKAEPLLSNFDDGFCTSDEEDDDVCSSSGNSSDEEEEEEMEKRYNSSYEDLAKYEDDFTVKGSFGNFSEIPGQKRKFKLLRRSRSIIDNLSLCDFVNGKSVVNLWEGVEKSFSFLDLNINEGKFASFFADMPAMSMSPAVVMSAAAGEAGLLGLSIWDLRSSMSRPAVQAEWRSDRKGQIVGVDSGRTGRVYVRDDGMSLAVGDARMVNTPLTADEEDDLWCDADGVSSVTE